MSIQVINLTRQYGQQRAVDNVSFSVREGEIVGFLGPNGAGKSTTMKIITGFLPATSGTVRIFNEDVAENPMFAKRNTGYLPEHNPLYDDMYVHEYLRFMGGLHGLGAKTPTRVEEMVHVCGLLPEQNKKISALSKGYRQRVGLAQALLHDPRVLILDEPTSGLDPNQLLEIRKLIRSVSSNKTVLFSTHILQEAEALCNRVVVINRGRIAADDRLENLKRGSAFIVVEFGDAVTEADLEAVPGVEAVKNIERYRFRISQKPGVDTRQSLVKFAAEKNLSLIELKQEENSLETVFSDLTNVAERARQ